MKIKIRLFVFYITENGHRNIPVRFVWYSRVVWSAFIDQRVRKTWLVICMTCFSLSSFCLHGSQLWVIAERSASFTRCSSLRYDFFNLRVIRSFVTKLSPKVQPTPSGIQTSNFLSTCKNRILAKLMLKSFWYVLITPLLITNVYTTLQYIC